jgi:RNA polymerase sigma-70 factor (sigma-E family)
VLDLPDSRGGIVPDEEAFRAWVQRCWPRLFHTAYLLVGDRGDAEDLVQITMERIQRHWLRLEHPDTYARRILINQTRSRWRRKGSIELPTDSLPDIETPDTTSTWDQRDELWRMLLELPPRMRAVLVLRYFEDLKEADIAAVLGCSIGSVKSQLSRGLDRLRALYQQDENGVLTQPRGERP